MQAIATAIGYVLGKIVAALTWLGQLAVVAFAALWHLVTDLVCWVFDGLLGIAVGALGAFNFDAFAAWVGTWAGLPAGVIEVLQAIGLSTALGLVITAIGIRLLMQLIPFTRLGS